METPPVPQHEKLRQIMFTAYGCALGGALLPAVGVQIPFLSLIALIIAFIKRKEAVGTLYESHCTWILRTFVIALAIGLVCAVVLASSTAIGMLAMMAVGLWVLYRMVKGVMRLWEQKPVEHPEGWL